jgi:hypothetical protein
MDYKEQIEQLRKQIDQLEQQINKPTIEVGKVYRYQYGIFMVTEVTEDEYEAFGFGLNGMFKMNSHIKADNDLIKEATPEEWITALTKYCDELFKDCDRVDRSGLDLDRGYPVITELMDDSSIGLEGSIFMYKGVYVMDKHGRFAKGLKKEVNWDVEIGDNENIITWNWLPKEKAGKYKLVRVD